MSWAAASAEQTNMIARGRASCNVRIIKNWICFDGSACGPQSIAIMGFRLRIPMQWRSIRPDVWLPSLEVIPAGNDPLASPDEAGKLYRMQLLAACALLPGGAVVLAVTHESCIVATWAAVFRGTVTHRYGCQVEARSA